MPQGRYRPEDIADQPQVAAPAKGRYALSDIQAKSVTTPMPKATPAIGRELALGGLSGFTGLPESKDPFTEAAKSYWQTLTEPTHMIPVYGPLSLGAKTVAGVASSLYGAVKETIPYQSSLARLRKPSAEDVEKAAHGTGTIAGIAAQVALMSKAPEAKTVGESASLRPFRKFMQEVAGAGKAKVSQIMGAEQVAANEAAERYQVATKASEHAAQYKDLENQKLWEQQKAKAEADYQAKVQEAREKWEKETAEVKAKNLEAEAKARAKYIEKSHEFDAAAKAQGRRTVLERGKQELSSVIKQNVDQTRALLEGNLDHRWDMLRETLGEATPLNSQQVYNAIRNARETYLKGAPPDLAEFDRLVNEMGFPKAESAFAQAMEMSTGELARRFPADFLERVGQATTLNVGEALAHRSSIGRRLGSSATPGNVKMALGMVQDALDAEIGKVAAAKGSAGIYSKLLRDYRQYKQDWINLTPAGSLGGSFLARVGAATGPFAQTLLEGKGYADMVQRFARYREFGARPEAMEAFARVQGEYKSIPKAKVPERPAWEAPKRAALPELPEVPRAAEVPPPEAGARTIPKQRVVRQRTPYEIRNQLLEMWADRPLRWWEIGFAFTPTPFALEPWLRFATRSPNFRNWIARQPR